MRLVAARHRWLVTGLLCLALATLASPSYGQTAAAHVTALDALRRASAVPVEVAVSPHTGLASFVSAAPGAPVAVAARPTDPAEDRAAEFIDAFGLAFGIRDRFETSLAKASPRDSLGMEHVRYQQLHGGVPVTGGEISIHLSGSAVVAVNAKTLPITEPINTTPSLEADAALVVAQQLVDKAFPQVGTTLSTPRLELLNRGLLEGRQTETRLAWFIEAKAEGVWQFIWIDAHTGRRLLDFSQLADALFRQVYNANGTNFLPGTLLRSEGDPPVTNQSSQTNQDANNAYDFAGDTYNYYLGQHGRDSFDGQGSPIISTINYCPGPPCPFPNAQWRGSQQQMVYGTGFASADDVVAHELTHA